jgi:malate dehydrogenase (oxaloacetate-decarboxylating)(NADP+)
MASGMARIPVDIELYREQLERRLGKARSVMLVFPELQSANLGDKPLQRLGGAEAVGPILVGMRKPVHLLQHGCDVNNIVNMAAIAVVDE